MRILIGHESDGAAQYQQRALTPATGLRKLGHKVYLSGYSMHGDIITAPDCNDEEVMEIMLRAQAEQKTPQIPAIKPPPDVVILRLYDQDESGSILEARSSGQLVFCDLDDDVWNMPEWNGWGAYMKRDGEYIYPDLPRRADKPRSIDLGHLERNLANADGVLCSTPRVAEAVKENVPGAFPFLCRNGLDWSKYTWPRKIVEHDKLRVAWMGVTSGSNHLGFLDILPALTHLLSEYDCEFWHLGAEKESPKITDWLPKKWSVPVRMVPWSPVRLLPWLLEQIDVGIIARRPHIFHEGQSNVSGLAYGAAGVPFVASRSAEYELLEKLGCGRTYGHPSGFAEAFGYLMDPKIREGMRELGRKAVVDHYNPKVTAEQYITAIEAVKFAATPH